MGTLLRDSPSIANNECFSRHTSYRGTVYRTVEANRWIEPGATVQINGNWSTGVIEDIRVCFVGDSFVNGTGDEAALGWAGRVCASANHSGTPLTYYNLGIRRDTSLDILQRWHSECSRRLPANADGRIVFSFGVNDTVFEDGAPRIADGHSIANFRQILMDSKMYKVLVVGPPPVSDAAQNERIRRLSEAYAHEAKLLEIPYIALFQPLINDHHYMMEIAGNDGSHPQGTGYGKMAGIVGTSVEWWFKQAT